jgi:hypothetical protein
VLGSMAQGKIVQLGVSALRVVPSYATIVGVLLLCGRRIWSRDIRGVAMALWVAGGVVHEGLLVGSPEKGPMEHRLRYAPWSRGIIRRAKLLCLPCHDGLRGWVGCLAPLAGWGVHSSGVPPLTEGILGGLHCPRCVFLEGPRLPCVP